MVSVNVKVASWAVVIVSCALAVYASKDGCKDNTKLLPNYKAYRNHCEAEAGPSGSDPNWPCFSMWSGSLHHVQATVNNGNTDPQEHFLIKDGYKQDFTVQDPSRLFVIKFGPASLTYSKADGDNCSRLILERTGPGVKEFWVSDETNKMRNADTVRTSPTDTSICTKWVHIYVDVE